MIDQDVIDLHLHEKQQRKSTNLEVDQDYTLQQISKFLKQQFLLQQNLIIIYRNDQRALPLSGDTVIKDILPRGKKQLTLYTKIQKKGSKKGESCCEIF